MQRTCARLYRQKKMRRKERKCLVLVHPAAHWQHQVRTEGHSWKPWQPLNSRASLMSSRSSPCPGGCPGVLNAAVGWVWWHGSEVRKPSFPMWEWCQSHAAAQQDDERQKASDLTPSVVLSSLQSRVLPCVQYKITQKCLISRKQVFALKEKSRPLRVP